MSWTQHLGNKLPIEAVYSQTPSLRNVRLHEIRLHQDGPQVSLRLDLNEFPDKPPRRWTAEGFNRAQLTLVLIDVSKFEMEGWNRDNIGDLAIEERDGNVCLELVSESVRIVCCAKFLEVEKLSGYCDSDARMR